MAQSCSAHNHFLLVFRGAIQASGGNPHSLPAQIETNSHPHFTFSNNSAPLTATTFCNYVSCVAENVRATAIALSGDESMLIVRGSHTELIDGEKTVISQFIVVDAITGQLSGTVGPPYRSFAPANAEFVDDSGSVLLVTYSVLSQQGITAPFFSLPVPFTFPSVMFLTFSPAPSLFPYSFSSTLPLPFSPSLPSSPFPYSLPFLSSPPLPLSSRFPPPCPFCSPTHTLFRCPLPPQPLTFYLAPSLSHSTPSVLTLFSSLPVLGAPFCPAR